MLRALLVLFLCRAVLPAALFAQFPASELAARRAALAAMMPDGAMVVFGAAEPEHDYLEFYQNPEMLYLSGIREPNSALVIVKEAARVTATAFVMPRDPAVEVWSGTRIGTDGATRISGAAARDRAELGSLLDSLATTGRPIIVAGAVRGASDDATMPDARELAAVLTKRPALTIQRSGNQMIARLRGKKSAAELALIRRAVEITVEAHRDAMRVATQQTHEYQIEATIEYNFRRRGAERPAFASIVGSGPNATVLHYNANERRIEPGDIVVMDVGASYMGYAADVTRTIPATGVFSPEQREIYQIVRGAQAAAERNAKPGMSAKAMTDSAYAAIAAGLARIGLIESPGATFDAIGAGGAVHQAPQVSLFYMHGLGHGIGLEVHDPEQYYFTGTIAEGSAFTIEPGIYVRRNVLEILADTPRNRALIAKIRPAVERYRNIGVRIEDDYIVTGAGLEWISRAPREIEEIEALMRRPVP